VNYPGQAFYHEHNPRIRRAEETWQRKQIVDVAKSFIGTPYRRGGSLKGIGVDCGTFLLEVLRECELASNEDLSALVGDFWNHGAEEKYLLRVARHARKVLETVCRPSSKIEAGNFIVTKMEHSQHFCHGAIVLDWPLIVHCIHPAVQQVNAGLDPMWACRPIEIYDPVKL
jgi:hypothetical protein